MIGGSAAVAGRGETAVGVGRERDDQRGGLCAGRRVADSTPELAVLRGEPTVLALEGERAAEERLHVDGGHADEATGGDDDGDERDALHGGPRGDQERLRRSGKLTVR